MAVPERRPLEPWSDDLCCPDLPQNVDQTVVDRALVVATEVVWALSGRKYGLADLKVRPCRDGGCEETLPPDAAWIGSTRLTFAGWPAWWASWARCGRCKDSCGCTALTSLRLPRRPAVELVEVKIDGASLALTGAEAAVRIDGWRDLVRLDGEPWPSCQDLTLDDDQVGTWSVTYRYGHPVPEGGKLAVEQLACEIAKSCLGMECDLPERVTAISRQGISMTVLDPQAFLDEGRTGLYLVDLFLAWSNPKRAMARAKVFRADDDRRRFRRTGT